FMDTNVVERWKVETEFMYLGIPFGDSGGVAWKSIVDKVLVRLSACSSVCARLSTLRERVIVVNVYALSLMNYVLKVDGELSEEDLSILRKKVRETLGNKATRVSWERLYAPVNKGGY